MSRFFAGALPDGYRPCGALWTIFKSLLWKTSLIGAAW